MKLFYQDNKIYLFFYILFLFYLFLQVIPIPVNFLKFFSYEKYLYLDKLQKNIFYSPISLDPTKSYFQILNYISLLLIILILKMIFYTDRHKDRFFLFLSFVGFVTSSIAVLLYLNNNPNILIFENSFYKDASAGFFINRTVFAVFLVFCLIASLEVLKKIENSKSKIKHDNYFKKFMLGYL